ncbi:PREDICTED: probable CCR4-associated factor 1 homolog 1 isoform X2 [Camelina sativa]|uniref:poly(A)-specific ribonuclease n=1 Tax=Camelina sativa TaxID=90675 RepID=A0ABM0XHN2_CAMSA|nr:PREDICTED: probable CCR4-associated factor 1 homolog 1 isoform X1 [Camelina sativa]XP_010486140.1 PREDICTED: probable CCR4-associated factor 1 homolog 1 isoform X2 [Camelina sativa]
MDKIHQPPPPPMATKVWRTNVDKEMDRMKTCLETFPLIAFDTEYPGIVFRTFIDSSNEEWYVALKGNVENTKLIQCGFTLFNAKGEIGGTWEFNFSNFGDPSDTRNEVSIEFLRRHGLDLQKIRDHGIDMYGYGFFPKLIAMFQSQEHVEFITFQGAYDFAYFLCILNNGKLPDTRGEFASEIVKVFGQVYDTKVMAGYCEGLGDHLGLSKLAQLLDITRVGRAHHAGSDSLMTALVFTKLKQVYEESMYARGLIYGTGKRMLQTSPAPAPAPPAPAPASLIPFMCHQNLASYPMFHDGYVSNYDVPSHCFIDECGQTWLLNQIGVYVPLNYHPLSSTVTYPSQTAPAVEYLGPLPNYYNKNACYVVE